PYMRAAQPQIGGKIVVETLERERAVISRSKRGGSVGDAPVAVEAAFKLADDRRPAGDRVEKRREGRWRLARSLDANVRDFGGAEGGKRTRRVGQAIKCFIVENNCFAVGAQLNVAFDCEAAADRRLRGAERVFDHPVRAVVQAAMGDRTLDKPGRGVDRI